MRKNVFGRQLKRDKNERKALFKSLMSSLVLNEQIKTTEQKAKAIQSTSEKLITLAKKHGQHSQSLLQKYLTPPAIKKLVSDVSARFLERHGGYTRIIRLTNRFSDNASMALIEWVEKSQISDAGSQESDDKKLSDSNRSESLVILKKTSKRKTISAKKVAPSKTQKKQRAVRKTK